MRRASGSTPKPPRGQHLGPTQHDVLRLLARRAGPRSAPVARHQLGRWCRDNGALSVADDAVEPTLSRSLHRLFELGLVDLRAGAWPVDLWLGEALELAGSAPEQAFLDALTDRRHGSPVPPDTVPLVLAIRQNLIAAHETGLCRDAIRALGPGGRRIRWLRVTDAGRRVLERDSRLPTC